VHTAFQLLSYSYHRAAGLAPWLLAAIVLAQLIQNMNLDVLASGGLRRRGAAAAAATTAFGAFTPFCACSIVPLIRGFLRAGIPLSIVMSFWIASPAMEPEIFGLTAKAFGWKVAVARLIGAIALGLGSAAVAHLMQSRGLLPRVLRDAPRHTPAGEAIPAGMRAGTGVPAPAGATAGQAAVIVLSPPRPAAELLLDSPADSCCSAVSADTDSGAAGDGGCGSTCSPPAAEQARPQRWRDQARQGLKEASVWDFGSGMLRDCWLLGRWMLLAIGIEALVRQFVPASAFAGIMGSSVPASVCIAAVLSIPLYLNGVSAIPIGAGLISMGMGSAAMTTFLLAGSITTIPAMAGVRVTVTSRVFILYLGTGIIGSILVGLLAAPFIG
jgi:uncharacterized protein